jgi:hypothetical protein
MAMQKGAVLNQQFIDALGLGERLLTLTRQMVNQPHPTLQEPMFHISTEELDETMYLERQYLYDEQINIKPSYGQGEKILAWTYHALRHRNADASNEPVKVLLASDLFLLGDPHEFIRFRTFLKTQRILDAQARDFLAKNHTRFGQLVQTPDGLYKVIDCLAQLADWPDPENGFKRRAGDEHTLEGIAKDYGQAMVATRNANGLLQALLRRTGQERLDIFRMLSFAEDKEQGAQGLMLFLRDIGAATGEKEIMRATAQINTGVDLSKGLEAIRRYLMRAPIGDH